MPSLPEQPMFTKQFLCFRCRAHQLVFNSCSSFELGGLCGWEVSCAHYERPC